LKHIIDLTKNNFDRIDFTEAKIIDFYCKKDLPTEFEFSVWGATLLLDPHWKHDKSFIPVHNFKDLYVSGIGIVRIDNLFGGNIEVYIYENAKDEQNRITVAKNHDGSELVFRRQWGNTDECKSVDEYLWECVIMWPYGFCNLKFYSNGNVDFKFNTEDLIFADDYLKDPYRYTFKEK